MPQDLSSRFKPCLSTQAVSVPEDFADYITQEKALIVQCHDKTNTVNIDIILNANAPFEYKPEKTTDKVLICIHGLLDSPFTMHDLGQYFAKRGYLVQGVRLPGHGTRPGDLLNVSVDHWLQVIHEAIESAQKIAEKVYLLGFSGGASLALYHSLMRKDIHGVITLAPSFKLLNKAAYLSGLVNIYGAYRGKIHWFNRQAEYDYARYECFPANLALQALKLAQRLSKAFASTVLKTPWQLILTQEDETICSKTALKLFRQLPNTDNQALIYTKKMPAFVSADNVEYRISRHLQDNILDFSHISLPICPNNPHYGIHGDQLQQIMPMLKSYQSEKVMKGAISKKNRQNYRLQRLTYNPDFDYMTQKIETFLNKIR